MPRLIIAFLFSLPLALQPAFACLSSFNSAPTPATTQTQPLATLNSQLTTGINTAKLASGLAAAATGHNVNTAAQTGGNTKAKMTKQ